MKNYDKFSYSHQRNRSDREVSSYEEHHQSSSPSQSTSASASSSVAATSVLNPLRHGTYKFAIAEDGILHSRIVAPPRICFAPVITELDAPNMPETPWTRLKKALLFNSLDQPSDDLIAGMPDFLQKVVRGVEEIDFETLGYFDWDHVEAALSSLEEQDQQRQESLSAAMGDALIAESDQEKVHSLMAFYRDKKEKFASERVTAIDRAKIEIIWKKARMLLVEKKNEDAVEESRIAQENAKSERRRRKIEQDRELLLQESMISNVSSSNNDNQIRRSSSRASSGNGLSREPSMGGVSNASSSATSTTKNRKSKSNILFGARGTIFNEKLKWTKKPKVDSNNITTTTPRF